MRTSKDIYKRQDGAFIAVGGMEIAPEDSKLWKGYDYDKQYWVFEGKRDTRTLEELRKSR